MKPSDPIFKKTEEPTPRSSYTPPGGQRSEPPSPPAVTEAPDTAPRPTGEGTPQKPLGSALSITSLVLGLFGVICCSCCGLPTGIAGIVLALVDRAKRGRFDGIALAGLITSIVSILLFIFSFATFFFLGIMDGLLDDGMVIPPAGSLSLWRFL